MSAFKQRNVTYSEFLEFRLQDIVSENVRRFIAVAGCTAKDLHYKTNLSLATINRLKAGEHLSIQGVCALAEALNKNPEDFFIPQERNRALSLNDNDIRYTRFRKFLRGGRYDTIGKTAAIVGLMQKVWEAWK